jgi:hypothetical protein
MHPASRSWLRLVPVLLVAALPYAGWAQGTEDFELMPANSTAYTARTWTGTDGVVWTAQGARTDQTMTGRAICFGNTANNPRTLTSPIYANGMGTLSFEYVRAFTGTGSRSLEVWVNGTQIGPTIAVSPTSDVVMSYMEAINIGGDVQLEIRSTGASQVKLDNIVWTPYSAGPTLNFSAATQSAPEGSGVVPVTLNISPATATGGTITIAVANGPGVVYGAGGDYTTAPAGGSGTITLTVAPGATTASLNVNLINDPFWEPNKTITFSITGVTGDLELGLPNTHVFTILNDDFTPTAFFATTGTNALESAGVVNVPVTITPAAAAAGTLTLTVVNGPGAVYGADYTTVPDGSGGSITVNVLGGATVVNIPVSLIDDAAIEDTETVTFTISSATGGLLFGPSASFVLSISDNDSPPTLLEAGDLVVVGVNSNTFACGGGSAGEDQVSFFCFKPIVFGTELIITDNGYSRCTPGLWGNTEGTVRLVRTGPTIPAGQVITLRITNTSGAGNIIGLAPDAGWSCTSLNGTTTVNLNSGGDQIFFGQGGVWSTNTVGGHNATYTGTIIYGFSTNPTFPWSASCATNPNQRSDLPPGIECFSMAPTLATDFNKYAGPLTTASQRDWIIRVDDVANWSSYGDCAAYNASGTNWLAAPILPFTPGAYVDGRWRGAISTDWFECKNWDNARIPTATSPVVIDPAWASRNCVVGLTAGSTAECASLVQRNAGGTSRQLTVQNNSSLLIGGPFRIERLVAGAGLITTVQGSSTLTATSVELQGQTPGASEALLRCEQAGSQVLIEGGVTIGVGGLLDLQGIGEGGLLELGGDFVNLNDEAAFQEQNSTVRFAGNGAQAIAIGTGPEVFANLVVAKSGGDLSLGGPVDVRNTLDLSSGRIMNGAGSVLTLRAGAAAINASDASHVNGPVQKIGSTPFSFPVGRNGWLRPCSLSAITGGSTVAFTAEYFYASPRTTFNNILEPTLDHISDCEYWMIDRSGGLGNAVVHLTWREPQSCGVTELASLRVARWDGTLWRDRGNGGATGDLFAGSIPTAAVQTEFSPWTLASINSQNPLPITLLSFTARPAGPEVLLNWSTASERDNAYFTVERSRDGERFEDILTVPGAGNSLVVRHYADTDPMPHPGLSFYRLRQTDFDGQNTVSDVVSVWMGAHDRPPLAVHAASDLLTAYHSFEPGARYTLIDMTGRLLSTGTTTQEGSLHLPLGGLPGGVYMLRMEDGARGESARFVR